MKTLIGIVMVVFAWTGTAMGQTVTADRFRLNTGPCVERSGSGTPEGAVIGNVCDTFHRTDTGTLYFKISGTGNTGWISWTNANTASALVSRDGSGGFAMGALIATAVTDSALTTGRVPISGTGGLLTDDADLTFATDTLSATKVAMSSLTSGRVPIISTSGLLIDDTDLTFATDTLTATKVIAPTSVTTPAVTASATTLTLTGAGIGITAVSNLGNSSYVSQTTGWRIDTLGAADFRYLFTDQLHAKSFIADLEQALAGGQIIAKSVAVVSQDFACPAYSAASTIAIEDLPNAANMQVFEVNDHVILRTFSRASGSLTIADCVGVVTAPDTSPAGYQTWTFTRNSVSANDGGLMGVGATVPKQSLALDYGVSGNGFYEVSAVDGIYGINSPYAQVVTWTGVPRASNLVPRVRVGNLRGITGTLEYGAVLGSYGSGTSKYLLASNLSFEAHNLALKLFDGATETVRIDPAVPAIAMGSTLPSAYGTGTGIWMGKDTTYKFRVGDPAGNRVSYDGDLTLVSANLIIGAAGISVTPSTTATDVRAYHFSSSYSGTNGLYAFETAGPNIRSLQLNNIGSGSVGYGVSILAQDSGGGHYANVSADVDAAHASSVTITGDTLSITGQSVPVAMSIGGVVTVTGFGTHTFSASGTGVNSLQVTNPTAGTGNFAQMAVTRDGSKGAYLNSFSSTWTTSGANLQGGSTLYVDGSGGLSVVADNAAGAIRFYSGGTTLRAQINTNGTQTWAPYGAGTATFDASGNITSVSDERFKDRITPLPYGLPEVLALRPVQHGYNGRSGLERDHLYGGFLAQDVQAVMPLAVGQNADGYLTLSDRPILGAVVHAIQQLDQRLQQLEATK